MLWEILLRFVLGGTIVCLFAAIGDALRPKSFAGIFGAAPSVALASLGLAFATHGGSYASTEGRSMLAGSAGLLAYAYLAGRLMLRRGRGTLPIAAGALVAWSAVALGLWTLLLR